MTRNLKVLGLAITAVFAMIAVSGAGSAQASLPVLECTASTNSCIVTGSELNTHTFNVEGGNVRCRSAFEATVPTLTNNVVTGIRAIYTGCRAFGVAAEVRMGGCSYTFEGKTDNNFQDTVNVDIVCPIGPITIVAPSLPCTITIGSQNRLTHIVLSNFGARIALFAINNNQTGAGCPAPGNSNNGAYTGETTLEGFNDNSTNRTEGTEVSLHVKTPDT